MSHEFDNFMHELTEKKAPSNAIEAEDRELEDACSHIWNIAQDFKLDPFPTHFEVVPPQVMYEIGSYGLPDRFSHWIHGRTYRQIKTSSDHGMLKIYEMVINSDPAQAFLLENNPPIENKFVMAHVLGHSDFFKNNHLFQETRRDMPESAARNAQRIKGYEEQEGRLVVEEVLDAVMAIEEHIDPFKPNRLSRSEEFQLWRNEARNREQKQASESEFADLFDLGKNQETYTVNIESPSLPPTPDKDILGFIVNHAPYLEDWERDIVDIVRSDSLYFYPQMRTKIMNEGWASYWHKHIMREMSERNLISSSENEHWWRLHSGVLQPNPQKLNPYYFGMKMFEYLEDYHNGNLNEKEKRWLEKEGRPIPPTYDGPFQESPGLEAIRDIMHKEDDKSFIRNHFDKNIADRMGMYIYEEHKTPQGTYLVVKDKGWQEIRDKLDNQLTNCGNPYITVVDGNYKRGQELFLRHEHEDQDLDPTYIEKTLPYIYKLWRRPVHIETVIDNKSVCFSYDGKEFHNS